MKTPLILLAAISSLSAHGQSTEKVFDNPGYWIDIPIQRKSVIESVSAKKVVHYTVRGDGDYFSSIYVSPNSSEPLTMTFEHSKLDTK